VFARLFERATRKCGALRVIGTIAHEREADDGNALHGSTHSSLCVSSNSWSEGEAFFLCGDFPFPNPLREDEVFLFYAAPHTI
jgi:hypothetical protein